MNEIIDKDSNRPIALKELAEKLGFHSSSIRKTIVAHGFVPFALSEHKNQPLYLSHKDAKLFEQKIKNKREYKIDRKEVHETKFGGVYFLEIPSYDGVIRVKIGWSDKLSDRFDTYRTIIPDLRVKAIWQTNDRWCEKPH